MASTPPPTYFMPVKTREEIEAELVDMLRRPRPETSEAKPKGSFAGNVLDAIVTAVTPRFSDTSGDSGGDSSGDGGGDGGGGGD